MAKNTINTIMVAATLLLSSNTVCSASFLQKDASASPDAGVVSPEVARVDERVQQAQVQLDTTRKQLSAVKAQLKAAEADLKAARAERQALALKNTANGLADASGLQQGTSPATTLPASATPANIPVVQPGMQVPSAMGTPGMPAQDGNDSSMNQSAPAPSDNGGSQPLR